MSVEYLNLNNRFSLRCGFVLKSTALDLQGKNLEQFDHVKKNLSLQDADELAAQEADPMFTIKSEGLSEDMKRIMAKLNTDDAAKVSKPSPFLPRVACKLIAGMKQSIMRATWKLQTALLVEIPCMQGRLSI